MTAICRPTAASTLLDLPNVIAEALVTGAALALSISGGKDSQAMLNLLTRHPQRSLWSGKMLALHADLGRMEWRETAATVERQAHDAGLELVVVSRPKGDLLERMKSEMRRTAPEGKPFWPTATKRYCTAEAKRDQLVKVHRRLGGVVIAAQGIRAEESPRRAKAQVVTVERRATSKRIRDLSPAEALAERKPEERLVLNWLPIFGVLIADVWAACDTSVFELEQRRALYRAYRETGDAALLAAALDGWTAHAAYVFGSSRLSCALCVLASRQDLETGAIHNPALFAELLAMERESGFSFQPNLRLAGLTAR
ncbi:3'-phosphoadenosine 5'-phosphosulfate sulfotransferase (PAPS reductase)/FAD synthetase [Azospirillum sp. OGB3]|uniref:phosphoadenosine phosphosulfate reductase domain-containing protein n=1 Tax=Azospirillum sp. OGB3 TaxID=2587012 RepID=UPI001605C72A|nr:phosphoadenosine phosphosulfate reductase family protein [Azospirillum sp. OGB3]MBB3267758.1 3'-phosphoadenosine 5'-phosphosulfate sulfotransferase (PAPS reductase)/FAD synthetase [Azospirillum sp. OGB3]